MKKTSTVRAVLVHKRMYYLTSEEKFDVGSERNNCVCAFYCFQVHIWTDLVNSYIAMNLDC